MKTDTYKHAGLRNKLVSEIKNKGIKDENVLTAIRSVPRHFFMDTSFTEIAYQDQPFSIGYGQTISQPYTVAFQTELLEVKKGIKILEIGTGSGYQACILSKMGAKVYTIERIKELYIKTKQFFNEYGYNPKIFYGDGYKGLPAYAPFDRIIVTAAASQIPEEIIKQLVLGGILVIPVNHTDEVQVMKKIIKTDIDSFSVEDHGFFRFVPMRVNKE